MKLKGLKAVFQLGFMYATCKFANYIPFEVVCVLPNALPFVGYVPQIDLSTH